MKGIILDGDSLGRDIDLSPVTDCFSSIEIFGSTKPHEIVPRITHADVVLTNKIRLGEDELRHCQRLKMISVMATGTNNVDLAYCAKNNIQVCNAKGYSTPSVVQHTITLMLALSTNLIPYQLDIKKNAWQQSNVFCLLDHPIQELSGKTLGILGYGDLGRAVAGVARAFGMEVLISERPGVKNSRAGERIAWQALLPQVDYLSLHCPLTPENQNIINASTLALMKPTAFLINTARGGLINSIDLIAALKTGRIHGAGIDVLNAEPPSIDEVLLAEDLPNLIVSPHNAWAAKESRARLLIQMKENILEGQKNHFPRSVLPA